jgi:hypothetical protein
MPAAGLFSGSASRTAGPWHREPVWGDPYSHDAFGGMLCEENVELGTRVLIGLQTRYVTVMGVGIEARRSGPHSWLFTL